MPSKSLRSLPKSERTGLPLQPFLAQIQDLSSLSPIAQYALGYGFHQLEELEKALPLYAGVPENSEWYSRARYARAVALIALKRQSEAREELNALLSRETPTEIDAAVQSWARLSSARLHFEMDSLEDATRDYQAIERESPHFAESIHELAQTQVRYAEKQTDIGQRRKAFERALATLELLFILEEEEQTIAEALMLKASIFIRLGKIDDAKLTLAYLLERFDPLTSYMQDLPQRIATLTNYYDLLSPGFKSDSLELVPMVSEYLAGGQKLQRGRVLIGDLRELYRAIDYLRLKSETLGQKLRIDPKGYFLPSGQRAYEQVDELEEAFSKSSNQLIKISSAIVRPLLNTDERLELDQLLNELETTYTEFSILKGSERAFIKSLGRQVDQETFAMTKTPQERISRDVAQTRARYEVTLRNLQQFVRTYYKRLAQKPGSGSRSESQIGEKLQELREKRLNLNDALKRNQDYQRAVVDGAVEGSWSRQAELKQLILLTEHFETHPLLLRPQTRDWLTEKLTQRRSFLDRAETKQGTLRPAGEIRDGANLMLLSLRLLESELNQSYLETYNLERTVQMTLSNDGRLSGVSLALALERSGKLLTRLRARSKKSRSKDQTSH